METKVINIKVKDGDVSELRAELKRLRVIPKSMFFF